MRGEERTLWMISRVIKVNYRLVLSSSSLKFLKKLKRDSTLYVRIVRSIRSLANDPYPIGAKKIMGTDEQLFRIRIGDYRILYMVHPQSHEIFISIIDKRSRAYRSLLVVL